MKTKQSKALGKLTDFTVPPTPDERITALEKRVATLEGLLAETMIALDGVNSQPREKVKPSPRHSKPPARAQTKKNASQSKTTPGVAIPEGVTTEILSAVEAAVNDKPRTAALSYCESDRTGCESLRTRLIAPLQHQTPTDDDAERRRREETHAFLEQK